MRVEDLHERLAKNNAGVHWTPDYVGEKRFGNWLEEARDWNISRNRFWGSCIPVWINDADPDDMICVGSIKELEELSGEKVTDLHKHFVDKIVIKKDGKTYHRTPEVLDCWFESGSMPYAQLHYPFENKELIDSRKFYPADFIAEGVDQTRGWFFTLHAIATMVFDSVAYKSVISNGLVLDKFGNKMSKHKGNTVDPFRAIEDYGTDPLRWYMISNSSPWDNLKFDEAGVTEVSRKLFGTLYNTYSFFALYANVDNFDPAAEQIPVEQRPEIDRWIISLLNTLVSTVDSELADYEPTKAARAISEFVTENLSNWYVRLNRKRFWGGEMNSDKLAAYQTLYQCLVTVSKLMAPIAPFYSDQLYRDLTGCAESVHLALYPEADASVIDKDLEHRMQMAQSITSMVLSLRRKKNLKVRQPLTAIMVPVADEAQRKAIEAVSNLIVNEVNVKGIKFVGNDEGILVKRIKPDFKKLGPKYGKIMKGLAKALTSMPQAGIIDFENTGSCTLDVAGQQAVVTLDDVEIISEDIPGWLVANEGNLTVALDITVTDELLREGMARELVNRIQNVRKSKDFDITDKIAVTIEPNGNTDGAVASFGDYIAKQVLAVSVKAAAVDAADPDAVQLDMDGFKLLVKVTKA